MSGFNLVKLIDPAVQLSTNVTPKGEYSNSTTYFTGDTVTYNGINYIAKVETTGNIPTNSTYWQVLYEDSAKYTKVRNQTGATIYKGTIVYISGSTGTLPLISKAKADSDSTSARTFGVVYEDIANNSDGRVLSAGPIDTLDTRTTATNPFTSDTLVDGDVVYLDPTTAGYVTNVKPSAPNHLVYVGFVVKASPTTGTIIYRIQNGYELEELHNVAISSVANNDTLVYESSTNLWKNKAISTVTGPASSTDSNIAVFDGTTGKIIKDGGILSSNLVTLAGTQTLTNKTISAPQLTGTSKIQSTGTLELYNTADQTTNYEKFVARYNSNVLELAGLYGGTGTARILRLGAATGAGSAMNRYFEVNSISTPILSMQWGSTGVGTSTTPIVSVGSASTLVSSTVVQSAFGVTPTVNQSGTGGYTALLVNPTETTTGSGTKLLADFQVGGVSKAKIDNTGVITSAAGTSSGNVVTIDGTQTLTNKTLTTPKIDSIKDANGNTSLNFLTYASAVNYFTLTNQASGSALSILAQGTDTDISMIIRSKGTGSYVALSPNSLNAFQIRTSTTPVNYWRAYASDTGVDPQLNVTGNDTNVSMNLTTRGTGVVKANGVEVVTISGTQTLTNKTLTSPKITSGNAPATATSTGTTGQVEWDADYVYICTGTNTWKRAAIATW